MALLQLLLLLLLYYLVSSAASNSSFTRTKPGCPGKCGDVRIPYPFGIASNCSIPGFDLSCNTSTSTHRLFLHLSGAATYRVVNISKSKIRIKNPVYAHRCENYRYVPTNITIMDLAGSPYTISDLNTVTQVGCTDLTVLEGFHAGVARRDFVGGCVTFCSTNNLSVGNTSCPGNACCQVAVPKGTVFLNVSVSGLKNMWASTEDARCSYSFLGEKDSSAFHPVSELYTPGVPRYTWMKNRTVVLDWRIGTRSCSDAPSLGGFACLNNSHCVNASGGIGGYRCSCFRGYQGNPYLPPGCQDIDECEKNPCHATGICTNTPGDYICRCPPGYLGNAGKNTIGCVAVIPKLSKLSIGLISGMGFTTLLSLSFLLAKFMRKRKNRKRRDNFFKQNGGLLLKQQASVNEAILGNIRIFTAKELEKATDRFNDSRILGRGGQGTVYKGMLSDGQIVAIKKSQFVEERKSKHVVEQFINEVVILSQINHRNVVKLLGCCLETRVPLLVYEYVHNGTLYHLVHDEENAEFMFLWNTRLKIAADVAGAVAYLHSATSLPIFHRDIKSSNILLDEKYVAKVSDFGASKSMPVDQTHLTTNVNGTFGYIDPEYFQSNQFTEKSDVYSFGVVLVELLTGLKPIISSPETEEEQKSLVLRFLSSMSEDKLNSILDDRVVLGQGEKECVVAVAKLAQRCLNLNGKNRPYMKEVATELDTLRFAQHAKSSEESAWDKEGGMILSIDDGNCNWTNTFDFPTNSFPDSFPNMFAKELRR
ncbi:wall-associated receptor kinase-like 1 [Salvia miltiorrhiza]|uniref:wall-associated receptor kinase-like 1 n=1 Tax=Salvia miltiorrhiza TaxID=226208 RepID=UPI0025ACFD45|nr:wall-associated receptor kinase-like 1 [Salvia miltiorrhiza]